MAAVEIVSVTDKRGRLTHKKYILRIETRANSALMDLLSAQLCGPNVDGTLGIYPQKLLAFYIKSDSLSSKKVFFFLFFHLDSF